MEDGFRYIFPHLLSIVGFAAAIVLVARMVGEYRHPGSKLAWLLAMLLIPWLGVPAYLMLGGRKVKRIARRKERLRIGGGRRAEGRAANDTERVLRIAGAPPARGGNAVEMVDDGVVAWGRTLELIRGARVRIEMATYILGTDATGEAIVAALAERASAGVEVRLLLDGFGSFSSCGRFVDPLREAGGKVGVFIPVWPFPSRGRPELRNHRKILVVDGGTAMVGGMNIAREYMAPERHAGMWMDAALVVRGPVVGEIAEVFACDWFFATGESLAVAGFESEGAEGGALVQVVASGPDVPEDPLYEAILAAILEARERVWIVTPYFVPDETLDRALALQAKLGRDVRVLLPARSNHAIADLARGCHLRRLHAAGVQIVYYPDGMVHSKLFVVDDGIAIAGSANMDVRSLYLNYEVNLFLYSTEGVEAVAGAIGRLMARSRRAESFEASTLRRWAEDVTTILSPLL